MLHQEESKRVVLTEEEEAVMDHIAAAMEGIKALGLRKVDGAYVNGSELAGAIHVLQGYVIQHMLQRLEPRVWGKWFE